jgi:hypothetical protein
MKIGLYALWAFLSLQVLAHDANGLKSAVAGDKLIKKVRNFIHTSQKERLKEEVWRSVADPFEKPMKHSLEDFEKSYSLDLYIKKYRASAYSFESEKAQGNYLSFSYNEMWGIADIDYGFCHGYTYVSYTLRFLLHFDPEFRYTEKSYYQNEDGTPKLETYLFLLEQSLTNLKPIVVPGFKNLKEMSKHPVIMRFLQIQVLDFWAKANFSYKGGVVPYQIAKGIKEIVQIPELDAAEGYLKRGILPIFYHIVDLDDLHVMTLLSLDRFAPEGAIFYGLNTVSKFQEMRSVTKGRDDPACKGKKCDTFYLAPYFDKYMGSMLMNTAAFYGKNDAILRDLADDSLLNYSQF